MRPLDWIDAGGMLLAYLLGFITLRVFEHVQLSGMRMRHRRILGELKQAEAEAVEITRKVRMQNALVGICAHVIDQHQRKRATLARDLEEARGDNSDRDWLGKKSDAMLGDQTDAIAPERGSES